jgi:acyl carrier protein
LAAEGAVRRSFLLVHHLAIVTILVLATFAAIAGTQPQVGLREKRSGAAPALTPRGGSQNDNARSKSKKNGNENKSSQPKRSYESQNAVEAEVKKIIVDQLKVDAKKVTPEARIAEDLGADDLDQVELIMSFEEEFGIEIPDQDAEKLKRVGDVNTYVWEHLKHR